MRYLSDYWQEEEDPAVLLTDEEAASIVYHDIFDYPLSAFDLIKWTAGKKVRLNQNVEIAKKKGYFFISPKEGIILKRLMRERSSKRKLELAKKVSFLLSFLPTVRLVAVTGAVAMMNAGETADVDLMIVTRRGSLWTTRAVAYFLLNFFGFKIRRPKEKDEKDKLCLNIWLDEDNLAWVKGKRNIYTAHEVAQTVPLVDKEETYACFLWQNRWIKDYWPLAVRLAEKKAKMGRFPKTIETLFRTVQFWYMRGKRTTEVVTKGKAIFHPFDWSQLVLSKMELFKV